MGGYVWHGGARAGTCVKKGLVGSLELRSIMYVCASNVEIVVFREPPVV